MTEDELKMVRALQKDRAEATARAEAAEKALHELTEPISDAGHTTADGLRHEMGQLRARAEAAEWKWSYACKCTDAAEKRADDLEARAEAAEEDAARLRGSIEKMLNGEIPLSTSIKAHFLAALETKP